jgi:hypothetical protein
MGRKGFAHLAIATMSNYTIIEIFQQKTNILHISQHFNLFMNRLKLGEVSYNEAEKLIHCFIELLNIETLLEGGDHLKQSRESVKSILCHTLNPIKTGVMILTAGNILTQKYPILKYLTEPMNEDII